MSRLRIVEWVRVPSKRRRFPDVWHVVADRDGLRDIFVGCGRKFLSLPGFDVASIPPFDDQRCAACEEALYRWGSM